MTDIAVWAPFAGTVELEVEPGTHLPMRRDDDGWWRDESHHRGRYRLVLDGTPVPDPRSAEQPEGVDGPSSTIDHESFAWTDGDWKGLAFEEAVIYELHIPTFTPDGTFDAAIAMFEHLVDLGVNTVEVMPVATFAGTRGWGYDGVLLFAPHHAFGGPDGMKRFVDAAHGRGLAVVLDVVYNHFGPSGNHLSRFGPYLTDQHRTPWGDAVNLDEAGSHEVREFFIANAIQWVRDYHVDGLRLDAVHALHDASAVPFLEQLAETVHLLGDLLGRHVWVIAESDLNDPRLVLAPGDGGMGLDAAWSDDFHHALHAVLTGERSGYYSDFGTLADLSAALQRVFVNDGTYSNYRDRIHGRPVGDVPRNRFVCFTQNHDQIGNRAVGERLLHLAGERRAQIAAALLLTGPFTPMLFQGEEWGSSSPFQYVVDYHDPDLADAVRTGRAREFAAFGWNADELPDPSAVDTLRRSQLRWDEIDEPEHRRMLRWYRDLLAVRRAESSLRDPSPASTSVKFSDDDHWLVLERGTIDIAVNLGPGRQSVPLGNGRRMLLLANDAGDDAPMLYPEAVSLAGDGVAILRREPVAER